MISIIDEYLKATRVLTNSYFFPREKYIEQYDYIKRNKAVDYDYPELVLCYSLKKTCEQIKIGNKDYLIYDIALGRFLNCMDALIFDECTQKWNVQMFLKKCYAEEYYSNGDYIRAFIQKVYVEEIKNEKPSDVIKNNTFDIRRYSMVFFQEMFIILHEISHYRFSKITKEEYNKKIQEKRELLIKNDATLFAINRDLDSFVKSIQGDSKYSDEMKKQMNDKNYWDAFYSYLMEFYNDDNNIEEIMCDEYAIFTLCELYIPQNKEVNHISNSMVDSIKKIIYVSCYIGLENVNYLTKIQQEARKAGQEQAKDYAELFNYIPNVQRRKRCLIQAIIQKEKELTDDTSNEIGCYWAEMAKSLDDLFEEMENIFQGKYRCCDLDKIISKVDKEYGNDIEKIVKSLYEILLW